MQSTLTTESKSKSKVIARLTVTRANGWRTIVEIHADARFMAFYRYYRQFGNRRSTKEFVRSASRIEYLSYFNAHLQKPGLDVIEKRLKAFGVESNPVIASKLRILKKRIYKRLLNARPDELGLTKLVTTDLQTPSRPILVSVPSYRLVAKVNHRKLHAGSVR
jgi:hypothetical protein